MPTYEISSGGATYQVDAPDERSALSALGQGQPPAQTDSAPAAPAAPPANAGTLGADDGGMLADIGHSTAQRAAGAWDAGTTAAANAFQGPLAREQAAMARTQTYGPIAGTIADMGAQIARFGDALSLPGHAASALLSPVMGTIHGTVGRILATLPGMGDSATLNEQQRAAIENNPVARGLKALGMAVPGSPTGATARQNADALIDRSLTFAAPESMPSAMASFAAPAGTRAASMGVGQTADAISGAPQAAQANVAAANAQARAANPALSQARDAGYVIHPAEAGVDSTVGNVASQFGGKIKTQQAASVRNQGVTNSIAAKELGLPADATLDETTFNGVRAKAANAYKVIQNSAASLPTGRVVADQEFLNDISGLGSSSAEFAADFPEAAAARSKAIEDVQKQVFKQDFSPKAGVEMIRNLRDDARVNLKNWTDADKTRLGLAQRDAADAVESLIERRLTEAGNPNAVANYQAARQTIAKSHDVEAATNAAGDVDARKLAAMGQKRPLSGGLQLIADTASAFPKSMQLPSKFGGVEKRSILDTLWSSGTGAAGIATGHTLTGLGAAAIPLARPLARDVALSNRVQDGLLGLRQQPGNVWPMIRQGALPAAAATNSLSGLQQEILRLFSPQQPQQ